MKMKTKKPNNALEILKRSTHIFHRCKLHHHNPTITAFLFSIFVILFLSSASHLATSSSATSIIHRRLHSILLTAGFPIESSSSPFHFHLLSLSQLTLAYPKTSIIPFLFLFLHMSKSATIEFVKHHLRHLDYYPETPYPSFYPLLYTHICCTFLLISANSALFFLLRNLFPPPLHHWIPPFGSVVYFFLVVTAVSVSNLALIISGWEEKGGFLAIVRATALIRGGVVDFATVIAVALPTNLAMAAVEAICRFISYGFDNDGWLWAILPGVLFLAFLYSVLIVVDTVAGCLLYYQSCKEVPEDENVPDLNYFRALEDGFIH